MQDFFTRVKEKNYLTLNTVELVVDLVPPDAVDFKAGQFMQFIIGKYFKPYSIVNVPDHNTYFKFCVGLIEGGVGSEFVKNIKVGDEIKMRGPSGVFTVKEFNRPHFFVCTGVGVAPFCSIIPDLLSRGFAQNIKMLFGLRQEEDVFYFDRFQHLASIYENFKFIPTLSQPKSHWPREVGRVTTYIDANYELYKNYIFFICGSTEMVKDVRALLINKKHNMRDIKLEIFV